MEQQKPENNLVGVESEVRVFFSSDINEELKTKVACMLLAKLGQLYGCKDNDRTKTCPHSGVLCGGHEFLPNGSRTYWDHGYLEYATPACMTTSEAVASVQTGDQMIRNAITKMMQTSEKKMSIAAIRNNIDHQGHSYGAHVNIRMTRKGYDRLFNDINILDVFVVPFFVTLPLICGSGRCSSEDGEEVFQIWQRSDFLKELVGLQTTFDRPLINTRDESLAADQDHARFHIIAFDANRLELAEYLKLGLLRLLCAAIDAGRVDVALELDNPMSAIRSISREPFKPLCLASNKSLTGLNIQRAFQVAFNKLYEQNIFAVRVPDASEILSRWDHVLTHLEKDPFSLIGSLDWVTKHAWLEQIRNDRRLNWSSLQMKWLDIQYHSVVDAVGIRGVQLVAKEHIEELTRNATMHSRAAIRGELLRKFGKEITEANWHYIVGDKNKIAYLLPDDPKSGLVEAMQGAKTLKEAATLLELTCVQLNSADKFQEQVIVSSQKEQQTTTI